MEEGFGAGPDHYGSSAGSGEWRKEDGKTAPATWTVSEGSLFTGRLLICNTDSEKELSIQTGQANSEVVLIQDGVVYYRSATRLYSAPLTKSGVGESRLLATS